MIQIVLPIAGAGKRFESAGYTLPKPCIPVHGIPMVELVVDNVRPRKPHCFTFLALQEHLQRFELAALLKRIAPGCQIIPVEQVTQGAACTVLLAREQINREDSLLIANSDQYVDIDINTFLEKLQTPRVDGLIMSFKTNHPRWSYVKLDKEGWATEVAEKRVISEDATVGIYAFSRGKDFVKAADSMIAKNLRVNGEFYIAPVYNELIGWKARVAAFPIGTLGVQMHGMGTPEDLTAFLDTQVSQRAAAKVRETYAPA